MRNDTGFTEAGQMFAAAHAAHYECRDLGEALKLYMGVMALYPDAQEAEYSCMQIHNIVKCVVPAQELLDAQVELALARLERGGTPVVEFALVQPIRTKRIG